MHDTICFKAKEVTLMIKLITACCALFAISTSTSLKATYELLIPMVSTQEYLHHAGDVQDYIIPDDITSGVVGVDLRGGDGGHRYGVNFGITSYFGKGGGGATIRTSFEVGSNPDQINPGAILRVIPGEAGEARAYTLGTACGGGGGGSALLLKQSLNDNDWIILAVAGGGGGATGGANDNVGNRGGNGVGWEAPCQYGVCESRVCRIDLSHQDGDNIPMYGAHGGSVLGGLGGFPAGHKGADDGRVKGGFGFGAGNAETGAFCHSAGGGGYCGGLSGREWEGSGYGGSSYINSDFITPANTKSYRGDGTQDHTRTHGHVMVLLQGYTELESYSVNITTAENQDENFTIVNAKSGLLRSYSDISTNTPYYDLKNLSFMLFPPATNNPFYQLYFAEESYPEHINEIRETISQCAHIIDIDLATMTNDSSQNSGELTTKGAYGTYQPAGTLLVWNWEEVENNNAIPNMQCFAAHGGLRPLVNFKKADLNQETMELTLEKLIYNAANTFSDKTFSNKLVITPFF